MMQNPTSSDAYTPTPTWWSLLAIVMLWASFLELPYVFYVLLRVVVCGWFTFSAYYLFNTNNKLGWACVGAAILFNPIIPIHMKKDDWQIVDFFAWCFIGVMAFYFGAIKHQQSSYQPQKNLDNQAPLSPETIHYYQTLAAKPDKNSPLLAIGIVGSLLLLVLALVLVLLNVMAQQKIQPPPAQVIPNESEPVKAAPPLAGTTPLAAYAGGSGTPLFVSEQGEASLATLAPYTPLWVANTGKLRLETHVKLVSGMTITAFVDESRIVMGAPPARPQAPDAAAQLARVIAGGAPVYLTENPAVPHYTLSENLPIIVIEQGTPRLAVTIETPQGQKVRAFVDRTTVVMGIPEEPLANAIVEIEPTTQATRTDYPPGSLPLSHISWGATLIERQHADTPEARMSGVVTRDDAMEYCQRDPGGKTDGTLGSIEQCANRLVEAERDHLYEATADCSESLIDTTHLGTFLYLASDGSGGWKNMDTGETVQGMASGESTISAQYELLCPTDWKRLTPENSIKILE